MTRFEKVVIAFITALALFSFSMCGYSVIKIKQAGGIDQVIIETGQKIIHIKKEMGKIKIEKGQKQ